MSDQATNALIAIVLGLGVAVLLVIPVAAAQYRIDGRFGPGDVSVLVTAAIYGLALWTYTLLPLPEEGGYFCQVPQLSPLGSITTISARGDGLVGLARDPAFLQVALNVALFVPFGFYVRRVLRRGVVVATVLGLAMSLLIETTQVTGVWGLYDCPYRLFDVDDLVVNTLGAMIGSLLSVGLVDRHAAPRPMPTSISYGRRLVGMVCDALFLVLAGVVGAVAWRGYEVFVRQTPLGQYDLDAQTVAQFTLPAAVQVVWVLLLGRTVGEHVVAVRTVPRRRGLLLLSRVVKLAVGLGPLLALPLLAESGPLYAVTVLPAYLLVTVVVAWRTRDHRGLSNAAAGLDLVVAGRRGRRTVGAVEDGS